MPVNARRLIRKMRGGAQAHLLEADDGHFYVVKFQNNPQHRRILVNEWIASVFLQYLQIATPEAAIVSLSKEFLEENADVGIQLGTQKAAVRPGWHFGSRYPGDPDKLAVYDFIPDSLLKQVINLNEFLGMLVFDKWTANADGRQSIFFRARYREWQPGEAALPRAGFVARMIDHGFAFNGPHWDFPDSPIQGLYHRPLVYERVRSLEDFQPWLDQVVNFPEEVVDEAYKQVPLEWLEGEDGALEKLLERLIERRRRVPDLILECRAAKAALFPSWGGA